MSDWENGLIAHRRSDGVFAVQAAPLRVMRSTSPLTAIDS